MTDYYQLFGVEQPAAEEPGAKEPEAAEPAAAGVNGPEIAEPAESPAEETAGEINEQMTQAEAEQTDTEYAGAPPSDNQDQKIKPIQSKEERARNAARRREQEKQQLREELRREWEAEKAAEDQSKEDGIIAGLGIINPYTGAKIEGRADFDAYQQQMEEERKSRLDKELRKSGMSRETFDELVSVSPVLRQAVGEVAAVKDQLQREKARVSGQQRLSGELEEIAKLDPSIKSLDDLRDKPYISQITEMIRNGYRLSDAFRLATEQERMQAALAKTKQAAINAAAGKEHHQPAATQAGAALVSVPEDVVRYYKLLNPNATAEEIKRHYNANLKR